MGKNNRQRRADKAKKRAKAKARERDRTQGGGGLGGGGFGSHGQRCSCGVDDDRTGERSRPASERLRVEAVYAAYQLACRSDRSADADAAMGELVQCQVGLVAAEIERDLARILPLLWDAGWLPGEVIRQARRRVGAVGERVGALAVSVDHTRRDPSTLHPRWRAHVEGLDMPVSDSETGVLLSDDVGRAGRASTPAPWLDVVRAAADVAGAWCRLGPLEPIIPAPGTAAAADREADSMIDLTRRRADPMLEKVRQLLAQAESTTFDSEAEVFTAKAQELMAKHAIDVALVWDRHNRSDEPTSIRLPIDDPYAQTKQMLLGEVAAANTCKSVIDDHHGMVHVVGFAGDLAWVETLFTSLLVQAQRELSRAGATEQVGGRRRGRGFRTSFLAAYANRIGERLAEVNAHVQRDYEAEPGCGDSGEPRRGALVPVLEKRSNAVNDATDQLFGELRTSSFRCGNDPLGWHEGRQAAERAELQPTVTA